MKKTPFKPSKRKCKGRAHGCNIWFMSRSSFQKVCNNIQCSIKYLREQNEKDRKKAVCAAKSEAKRWRVEKKKRREKLKTKSKWLQEAQSQCNKYIRLRDAKEPCISCGKANGGKFNAGHYQSVKSRSELRFHPLNIHKQCEPCNSNLSGNIINYRISLVEKIGLENVEWLESHHDYIPWTIEDAKEIKEFYKEEIRRIKNETY